MESSDNSKKINKIFKAGAKAILSQIPVASAFTVFLDEYINSNWQDRVNMVQEDIIKQLYKMDDNIYEKIAETDNVASIFASTYQSALMDIDENKIELYIKLLINTINNEHINNSKTHIFLNYLRNFSIMHIKVLQYFSIPHVDERTTGFQKIVKSEFSTPQQDIIDIISQTNFELVEDIDLLNAVIYDLYNARMLDISKLNDIMFNTFGAKNISKKTTFFGDEFIALIAMNS